MTQQADLLLYVQHLLGIGHLKRAALIARAASAQGLTVVVATGGLPVADADFGEAEVVQLTPALRTLDQDFSGLVSDSGQAADEAMKETRRAQLRALFEERRPRVLLTEMFPFGRRQMRFELIPLLQAAEVAPWKPVIAASVRDILTTLKQPGKIAWIVETAQRYYHQILVHGDPRLIPFERTFPQAVGLADRISYTGYVVDSALPERHYDPDGPILVSTGGGAVAEPLVRAVLEAYLSSPLKDRPWRVLIGHNLPEPAFQALKAAAPSGLTVERSRPDFLTLLSEAGLSISQAGYNTSLEVLAAGVPAVVVPFAAGGESEQSLRAQLLAEAGWLVSLPEAGLTGERLNDAMGRALALARSPVADPGLSDGSPPVDLRFSLAGAEETARQLARLAATPIEERH
ncbi:MAG: glycosyltransferase [Pseudomonadota bacterium]